MRLPGRFISPELTFIILFCLSFGISAIAVQYNSASVELHLTAKSLKQDTFQVFWSDSHGRYSEEQSSIRQIARHEDTLIFPMTFQGNITSIRLDPLADKGRVTISSAVLHQPFKKPVDIYPHLTSGALTNLQEGTIVINDSSLELRSQGNDPAFQFAYEVSAITPLGSAAILALSILFALLLYPLVNQRLLKGTKESGTLSITLERDLPLIVPAALEALTGQLANSGRQTHRRYIFKISSIDRSSLLTLMKEIKLFNPHSSSAFHYNRTGEI